MTPEHFMREAIGEAETGWRGGRGGPFGCVVVRHGEIVGRGHNRVTSANDPTAHAEIVAIRDACARLGTFRLDDCELYSSCEPCPMCLAAIHWARLPVAYYANTRADAAAIGFDDDAIHRQLAQPAATPSTVTLRPLLREEALPSFHAWAASPGRLRY